MHSCLRGKFGVLASCLLASIVMVAYSSSARAQLSAGAVVIPEFFEELYRVSPAGGTATDLLNSPVFDKVLGHHLEIADASTAYIVSFNQLYKFDFPSGAITFVDQLSFTPSEITLGTNGDLIAVGPNDVFRINPNTGAETSLYTETFFSPNDAVTDSSGNIYLTEFFDALGVLSPAGNFSKIGNYSTNKFQNLDLGPDGFLYLSTTVGESFYRVNPATGVGTLLDTGVFTFIDDLQVDASGDILFAGEVNSKQGVFRFDPQTTALTTIVDEDTVNGGFFNPQDIAIFLSQETFASADFDHNGSVDGADLAFLQNAYGVGSAGDVDGDSDTDGSDLLAWQRQFTRGSGSVAGTLAVPEPNTTILLGGTLVVCLLLGSKDQRR
ncbi:MAG: hypothetical protein GXP24_06255 [Planctomycetes bacterium]|nr:hypothetical protein [Planctomycetota bacterium]